MDMVKMPAKHSMCVAYLHALCDAIFLPDPEDKVAIKEVLQHSNLTWEQMVFTHSD